MTCFVKKIWEVEVAMQFTGCGTALVTPFQPDCSLDEATLRKLVQRQIRGRVDFLVPCGTTGESATLTRREHLRVVAKKRPTERFLSLLGQGAITRRKSSSLHANWNRSAPTACFPSRLITTSPRRKGFTSTIAPSRVPRACPWSFTMCPAVAAPTSSLRP